MSDLTTGAFWSAAVERAVKTFAQAVLAVLTVAGTTALDVDWQQLALAGLLAAGISVLTSVASNGIGNNGPSLASEAIVPNPPVPPGQ